MKLEGGFLQNIGACHNAMEKQGYDLMMHAFLLQDSELI